MTRIFRLHILTIATIASILISVVPSYCYLSKDQARSEATHIMFRLFNYKALDSQAQATLAIFIQEFAKSTFEGVSYSQFNEENVAEMAIEASAEWIATQATTIALREVMTDATFNPHFNGVNYCNQAPLRKAIHRAFLAQVKRTTKKPLELVNCGEFHDFVGQNLRTKVREQISTIIHRDCGAYCADTGAKMLLNCGHMLHRECYQQLQQPAKCPLCRESLAYLADTKPAQAKPVSVPAYQPQTVVYQPSSYSTPTPQYQPLDDAGIASSPAPESGWFSQMIAALFGC